MRNRLLGAISHGGHAQALIQTCIVHLIRNSLNYVAWKDGKPLAAQLRLIYGAVDAAAAETAPETFEQGDYGTRCPLIVQAWRRQWAQVIPFFGFPPEVRRLIYTPTPSRACTCACAKS